jgi:GNAT superfamily N-acetyltransferase
MARYEFLREFCESDAREVARWPTSMEEVRLWAGSDPGWPVVDASVFGRWHAEPDVQPYVLCDGEEPVGYGEVWIDEPEQEVELARIIVSSDYRGHGMGRHLVRLLLEQASLAGLLDASAWFPRTGWPSPVIAARGSRPYPNPSARSSTAGSRSTTSGCTALWVEAAGVALEDGNTFERGL